MLLSHSELHKLVIDGVISNVEFNYINSSSIDLTLGRHILIEREESRTISLNKREPLATAEYDLLEEECYILYPGEFILAQSQQVFNLPDNISAEYKLKSSMARIGLEHLNAGWCDAGWNGSVLTLELRNMTRNHSIKLHCGDRIGQMVFFKHEPVPEKHNYSTRGRYNGDLVVNGIKP